MHRMQAKILQLASRGSVSQPPPTALATTYNKNHTDFLSHVMPLLAAVRIRTERLAHLVHPLKPLELLKPLQLLDALIIFTVADNQLICRV